MDPETVPTDRPLFRIKLVEPMRTVPAGIQVKLGGADCRGRSVNAILHSSRVLPVSHDAVS